MRAYVSGTTTATRTDSAVVVVHATTTGHVSASGVLTAGPIVAAAVVAVVGVVLVAGGIWWLNRAKRVSKHSTHEDELNTPGVCYHRHKHHKQYQCHRHHLHHPQHRHHHYRPDHRYHQQHYCHYNHDHPPHRLSIQTLVCCKQTQQLVTTELIQWIAKSRYNKSTEGICKCCNYTYKEITCVCFTNTLCTM